MGFEPTEPAKVQRFSRPPHSTTLPPLHTVFYEGIRPPTYSTEVVLPMKGCDRNMELIDRFFRQRSMGFRFVGEFIRRTTG